MSFRNFVLSVTLPALVVLVASEYPHITMQLLYLTGLSIFW